MPRIKRCYYFECKNTSKEKAMFPFPWKKSARLKAWLNNCGNTEIVDLRPIQFRFKYVCIEHFSKYDMQKLPSGKISLFQCAVPLHYQAPEGPEPHKRKRCYKKGCQCMFEIKKPMCSYYNCESTSDVKELFRFPWKQLNTLKEWVKNCGNKSIADLPLDSYNYLYLCIDHFKPEYVRVQSNSHRILMRWAIPYPYQPPEDDLQPCTSLPGKLLCDDDRLKDLDNEYFPFTVRRDASSEPASNQDIPLPAQRVLKCEDRINDRALRAMMPADSFTCNWSCQREMFMGKKEIFAVSEGPNFKIDEHTRAIEVFYNMFDYDFVYILCAETNQYADKKIVKLKENNQFTPDNPLWQWTPTNRNEIFSFLTLLILQGLHPLPEDKSYFTTCQPSFSKIMTYDRYLLLESLLYATDESPEKSKLCIVQPMIDYFNQKFSSLYKPAKEIVFEEFLLNSNGLLTFSQKIESRSENDELKIYELCEAVTGYLWRFYVYDVKEDRLDMDAVYRMKDSEIDVLGATSTARLVYSLMEPLLNRGHTLFLDHFFNSPLLARCLKKQKTDCCGTTRLDRQLVPFNCRTLKKEELENEKIIMKYCRDMTFMVWRDNNLVSMISTFEPLPQHCEKEANNDHVPPLVRYYNKSMQGIERRTKCLYSNQIERFGREWTKVLFRRIFNIALYNCYIVFSAVNTQHSHRQFRLSLAEDLFKIHQSSIDFTTYRKLLQCSIELLHKKLHNEQPP